MDLKEEDYFTFARAHHWAPDIYFYEEKLFSVGQINQMP